LRYALDADALIGALDGSDPHHSQARELFRVWRMQNDSTLISVVNLSEVLVAPAADPQSLRAAREAIAALGVTIHSPTEAIGIGAARFRGRHPISLPDAYLLATARQTGSTVVSFDHKVARAAAAEDIPVAAA
jgi:predicted nucleic acid-binding protein